jgi:hypothetical protein
MLDQEEKRKRVSSFSHPVMKNGIFLVFSLATMTLKNPIQKESAILCPRFFAFPLTMKPFLRKRKDFSFGVFPSRSMFYDSFEGRRGDFSETKTKTAYRNELPLPYRLPIFLTMGDSAYSFSLTTFSRTGKLLQIEYALNAVANGRTSLGICAKDGVVIATDKKLTSELVDMADVHKVELLTPSCGVCYAGVGPDFRVLGELFRVI